LAPPLRHTAAVTQLVQLGRLMQTIRGCAACPQMIGPPVVGERVMSPVMLIGQAPGTKEGPAGKPFAWTAGKTLFKWFAELGLAEAPFRRAVYMAAVCRCFPGKDPKGGDRVPAKDEIERCGRHLAAEVALLRPQLVIPVGKLAIAQVVPEAKQLADIVGVTRRAVLAGHPVDVVALPHPSGASTWHRTEPGKTLLIRALAQLAQHPAWQTLTAAVEAA
jgi:uracil-DNA glycosylase